MRKELSVQWVWSSLSPSLRFPVDSLTGLRHFQSSSLSVGSALSNQLSTLRRATGRVVVGATGRPLYETFRASAFCSDTRHDGESRGALGGRRLGDGQE